MKIKGSRHQNSESVIDYERLYNIDEEIQLLKEVKDTQDELQILSGLLETQISVLKQATEVMSDRRDFQDTTLRFPFDFGILHQLVIDQERRRSSLQARLQAEATTKAVSRCPLNLRDFVA